MARAVRSNSSIKPAAFAVIATMLIVTGCARNAPSLPPDLEGDASAISTAMSNVPQDIQQMTCKQINAEIENLAEHDSYLEQQIKENRGKNQVAGYIAGVIFLPALLATENDDGTKTLLDENQKRRDHLVVAYRGNNCPSTY